MPVSCYSGGKRLRDLLRGKVSVPLRRSAAAAARYGGLRLQLECRKGGVSLVLLIALGTAYPASAQDAPAATAQQNEHHAADTVKFLTGAAGAFVEHEGDHLLFDLLFDAHPYVASVHLGPVPFFAIAHVQQSPRREFIITSAGFWTQEATSEWLLTRRPHLRDEHAPFDKGAFAFDVLTSIGYGVVALFKAGPYERDTRGMAQSIGIAEPAIGVIVMAPALLDAYRYFNPDARWAVWASRMVKGSSVLLVAK
jgi:hypothetical protein